MNLEACTQAIRTKVGADSGLNATLKFDCGADGIIRIDGASTPNTVIMAGKLKVSGDMGVAMRLQRVI